MLSPTIGMTRIAQAGLIAALISSTTLLSHATQLLLYSPQGGPMQWNGFPPVVDTDFLESRVSATFEVSEGIRIESVRVWVNGDEAPAWVYVRPFSGGWEQQLKTSIPLEHVTDAPAKWQGKSGLRWDLLPGTYNIFLQAPEIPYGYGYHGAPRFPAIDIVDYHDYSEFDLHIPFGIQVYGSYLSAIPEPATYGMMGGLMLFAAAARRNWMKRQALRKKA